MAEEQRSRRFSSGEMSSEDDEDLWNGLRVDFKLEASEFPDDKIYGRIRVDPESSRRLIKKFTLFVDKRQIGDLNPQATHVSASGFHSKKEGKRCAQIEALPHSKSKDLQKQFSASRDFFFNGRSFFANPKITFKPSSLEKASGTVTMIQWYHLGDDKAQRYLLYLDGKQIQQVSQFSDGKIVVGIHDLRKNTKHEFQLVATRNRKETYRSDPLQFTVPEPGQYDEEIINVREDRMPQTFRAMPLQDDDDDVQEEVKPPPEITLRCCDRAPHDRFPGIDHYLPPIPSPKK